MFSISVELQNRLNEKQIIITSVLQFSPINFKSSAHKLNNVYLFFVLTLWSFVGRKRARCGFASLILNKTDERRKRNIFNKMITPQLRENLNPFHNKHYRLSRLRKQKRKETEEDREGVAKLFETSQILLSTRIVFKVAKERGFNLTRQNSNYDSSSDFDFSL